MQPNLETHTQPPLLPGETLLCIEQPNPRQYAQPTVRAWLAAVTLSAILTFVAVLWIDTPSAFLLLFVPPLLLVATVIIKRDNAKEAQQFVQGATDQRQFSPTIEERV